MNWKRALRSQGYNVAFLLEDPYGSILKRKLPWVYQYPQFCGGQIIVDSSGAQSDSEGTTNGRQTLVDTVYTLAANVCLYAHELDNGVVEFLVYVVPLPGTAPNVKGTLITKLMVTKIELNSAKADILKFSIEKILEKYLKKILSR